MLIIIVSMHGTECARVVTPLVELSDETWKWSFGKLLEFHLYNRTAVARPRYVDSRKGLTCKVWLVRIDCHTWDRHGRQWCLFTITCCFLDKFGGMYTLNAARPYPVVWLWGFSCEI